MGLTTTKTTGKRTSTNGPAARLPAITGPLPYVSIDIETRDASKEAIEAARARWKPPGNMRDPAKIEERRREVAASIAEESALLDDAPVSVVCCASPFGSIALNGVSALPFDLGDGVQAVGCGDEIGLLLALREWLNGATSRESTVIVGFNIARFDAPHLRLRYVKNRLKLPDVFQPQRDVAEDVEFFDVMRRFLARYTSERSGDLFISLDEVLDRLGLPHSGVSGAEVPRLIREGHVKEVLGKCLVDTLGTLRAMEIMTCQLAGMR